MWNFAALDTTPLNSPLSLFSALCRPKTVKYCNENSLPCHPFPLKLLPTCENIGLPSRPRPTLPSAATARPYTRPTLPTPKSHVIPPGPHSSAAQKPRNINDSISKPETSSRDLRAKFLSCTTVPGTPRPIGGRHGTCGAWPGIKPTISTPGTTGVEGAGGAGGHGRASRRGAERSEAA